MPDAIRYVEGGLERPRNAAGKRRCGALGIRGVRGAGGDLPLIAVNSNYGFLYHILYRLITVL